MPTRRKISEWSATQRIAQALVFPFLLGGAMLSMALGISYFELPPLLIATPIALVFGFVFIPLFEWWLPYREDWRIARSDFKIDLLNILINNGVVEKIWTMALTFALAGSAAMASSAVGVNLWPHHWPLAAQFILLAVISEFGSYWYHRFAHKTPWMWRLHAVHHSPSRLHFLNAPRLHPLDKIIAFVPEFLPIVLLGVNIEIIALWTVYNAVTGLAQHANICMRLGPLNYVFSINELHRWHHSKLVKESDTNFGNNLIIFDLVFGTYFLPKDRMIEEIGLLNPDYPPDYLGQLSAPFGERDLSKPLGYVAG